MLWLRSTASSLWPVEIYDLGPFDLAQSLPRTLVEGTTARIWDLGSAA